MSVTTVTALRVGCEHVDEEGRGCDAQLLSDAAIGRAGVLLGAAERGWAVEAGVLCPRHRPRVSAATTS